MRDRSKPDTRRSQQRFAQQSRLCLVENHSGWAFAAMRIFVCQPRPWLDGAAGDFHCPFTSMTTMRSRVAPWSGVSPLLAQLPPSGASDFLDCTAAWAGVAVATLRAMRTGGRHPSSPPRLHRGLTTAGRHRRRRSAGARASASDGEPGGEILCGKPHKSSYVEPANMRRSGAVSRTGAGWEWVSAPHIHRFSRKLRRRSGGR